MKFPKILIAGIIGVGVAAAAFGSAASITTTVGSFGGESAAVSSCDSALTATWDSSYDATLAEYKVTNVTVGELDGASCDGATLKVTLSDSGNTALGTEKTSAVASTDTEKVLDFSADNISAESTENVNIVLVGP